MPGVGNRILVVTKFRYLGDTIVATPFLRRLHEGVPNASITLLSGPAIPALLQYCPYVEEIIPFAPGRPRAMAKNMELIRAIRARRFDTAFLLNRSLHSALVTCMAGIPQRVGFDTEHRGALLTSRVKYDWSKPDRECALDLLRKTSIAADPALPELWVSTAEQEEASRLMEARGVEAGQMVIGVQAGAHDPEVREWGADKFAEVADRLSERWGARIVLLGSAEERSVCDRVAATMNRTAINLAGETTLRQALAIISQCTLWVGNDGGLLHAAAALCAASVGIFGPTKARRWGYDTPAHRTVVHFTAETKPDAGAIRRSLDAIDPDEVIGEAEAALAAGNSKERV